jgi:formyl-CoA transferase
MLLAGPFAGRLLGDLGAEVIKVEPPGKPDPLRDWGKARYEGRSLWWPVQSRNKKCITLDLHTERGQQLLLELAQHADVLLENFRPGTLERWNIGPDRLWEVNPRLVVCRVSGYGQTGPYASRAGFASVAEAMGGLRHINGFPGEAPPRLHISLGDSLAGIFAALGILAALHRRDGLGFGRGQVVDVSLIESCFALLESTVPEYDRLGIVRGPSGMGLDGIAPSNSFMSSDGKWIVIAANADNVFRRLCAAMEQPELADDPRFATHLVSWLSSEPRESSSKTRARSATTRSGQVGSTKSCLVKPRGPVKGLRVFLVLAQATRSLFAPAASRSGGTGRSARPRHHPHPKHKGA